MSGVFLYLNDHRSFFVKLIKKHFPENSQGQQVGDKVKLWKTFTKAGELLLKNSSKSYTSGSLKAKYKEIKGGSRLLDRTVTNR